MKLGYEVTEKMSTAFARDGRLVERSSARPGHGVEVSAAGGGKRIYVRAVRSRRCAQSGPRPGATVAVPGPKELKRSR